MSGMYNLTLSVRYLSGPNSDPWHLEQDVPFTHQLNNPNYRP